MSPLHGRGVLRLTLLAVALSASSVPAAADSRLELGFEERVRSENWDDVTDFDGRVADARHQLRFRTRLWGKLDLGSRLEAMLGLNNESRRIFTPDQPMKLDEIIFETFYVDYRFGERLRARLGRQDIRRGDGFLILDGGPLDGSRTMYVNALAVTWSPGASRLELVGISDPSRDRYLPVINSQDRFLIETDEHALGLYFTAGGIPATGLEGYYFHKWETGDNRKPSSPAYQADRRLHTLGARATREFGCGWSAHAEAAGQAGRQGADTELLAWGAQATLRKSLAVTARPTLAVGCIGLSGDDPATAKVEGWDPLFSRWPKWSEAYIYTQITEKGPAYWTNWSALRAEVTGSPAGWLDLRATYYRMGAFHPWPGDSALYAAGKTRGDLFEARADVKVGKAWRGHVMGEWITPGGFYASRDGAWWLRCEVTYTFRRTFAL